MSSSNSDIKTWKKVGVISQVHGIQGELFLFVPSQDFDFLKKLKSFKLQKPSPSQVQQEYQLKGFRLHKKGAILRVQEITTRNQSEEWLKSDFMVPSDLLISKSKERIYLDEIKGFEVYDQDRKLGFIEQFSSNGPQDILMITPASGQAHIEVPFVEAFIVEILFEEKKIIMQLPEGLVEINIKGK